MSDNHKIVPVENVEIQTQQRAELHPFIERAMETGKLDIESMERLLDVQLKWEANEARKAFTEAKVKLKAELPTAIEHDKSVSYDGRSTTFTFATMAKAMDIVQPMLTKFGFAHEWIPETLPNGDIKITCRLTHVQGHAEDFPLSAPPDRSGGKNAIQSVGSTSSYLQRYTFLMSLGIVTRDMKCTDQLHGENAQDAVDSDKNLQAVAYMQSIGITVSEAEKRVQRNVKSWTAGDLAILKKWIKEKKQIKI